MKISEVFASIQGEGVLSGVPSLFLRVSGCNLRCVWCDTPYTSWEPEGEEWALERVLEWVRGHPDYRHVVLTGGEPMLFQESVQWTEALRALGLHITVETAGTVWQPVACDLMSISPKLSNSTPWTREGGLRAPAHERLRMNLPVLRRLMESYEYQLKFVVATPEDLGEILELLPALNAPAGRVLLMPEGIDVDILNQRCVWLAEICKQYGFRLCPRLHVLLWGARKGV